MDLSASTQPTTVTDRATPGMPLKDFGSFVHSSPISDAEIKEHRSLDTVYVSLHLPRQHHRGRRRGRHRHGHSKKSSQPPSEITINEATHPSQHVQFLLLGDEDDDEEHRTHDLFCELGELWAGEMEWKETARWIKFEEDVEEGGERWSKPHVATLSLHSLFEFRSCIHSGTVILDMDCQLLFQAIDIMLDNMCASNQLEETVKDKVREVLLLRHRHLNEKHDKRHHDNSNSKLHLPFVRSLTDIGKKYSFSKEMQCAQDGIEATENAASTLSATDDENKSKISTGAKTLPNLTIAKNDSQSKLDQTSISSSFLKRNQSSATDLPEAASSVKMQEQPTKLNMHFMKKIPPGSEAANVLVGELDFLNHQIAAFIRLKTSTVIGDLTEVPVPSKFIFVLLGPVGNQSKYHEIGRSIATLMTDEVFHDVAYHAKNREDLLAGIDEFLDQVTVLPPGEWDPSIRIEPPKSVPSQEGRKTGEAMTPLPNGKHVVVHEEEETHGDDMTLKRTGRLFGGLRNDIRRKAPFYISDFKDALNVQSLASFMFLYFACLTPIITFGGLLADATKNDLGAFESLLSGAIVGVIYSLFSGQPLTIMGSTGPVLVFESIMFNFCKDHGWYYLSLRFWVGLWTGLILLTMVAFDLSALVRYITRFTEESFAALISIIFIVEAFSKLLAILNKAPVNINPHVSPFHDCICVPRAENVNASIYTNMSAIIGNSSSATTTSFISAITKLSTETLYNVTTQEPNWSKMPRDECVDMGGALKGDGCKYVADVFFLSCLLFIGTFILAYRLKIAKTGRFFPTWVRQLISDFAVVLAIGIMVGIDASLGLNTPKLEVPPKFQPTNYQNRGWIIPPFPDKNPTWLCFAAFLPALLATILIFMDQQITAVIVNRKENLLKKGCGYHLDLLIVAILIMINSLLGLPFFVAATVLSINHVMSLKKESECTAPGERPKFLGVREQRLTGACIFLMIGLSVFLTSILRYIPMPVLFGVFLYMGTSSLKGMQFVNRLTILFMPMKYQPDYTFLRHVRVRRVHLFTIVQVLCLALLWVIKTIKSISIAFPIMVLAMCFIRKALDWVFTQTELKWLDDIMPEISLREKDDKDKLVEIEMQVEETEIILDPKCVKENREYQPQASIVNFAISGDSDCSINQVNITNEMTKCAIWKNLKSIESHPFSTVNESGSSNGKRLPMHGRPVVIRIERKHKKRSRNSKDGTPSLPTIPSSRAEKEPLKNKKGSVAFYIDEEESDKDEKDNLMPQIVVDPPSDCGSYGSSNEKE